MSTHYKLMCEKHRETVQAASRTAGGVAQLGDSLRCLGPFVIAHRGCPLRAVSEHDDDYFLDGDAGRTEWAQACLNRNIQAAKDDGRWL